MSHKNKQTLESQVHDVFEKMFSPGRSKDDDKKSASERYDEIKEKDPSYILTKQEYINNSVRQHIYSYGTYKTYKKHTEYFIQWVKENYKGKDRRTLEQIKPYAVIWMQKRIDEGNSPSTLKMELSALAKMFQCSATAFDVKLPERKRDCITRSRGYAKRDTGFSLEKNKEIINFCRATGLRRNELTTLKGDQLVNVNGLYYLRIEGKGGRVRTSPIIGEHTEEVISKCKSAGHDLVWNHVPSHMDVHSYRSDYATAIYLSYERDLSTLTKKEKYYCRGDRKGTVFDRTAMLYASEALGHSRTSVVGAHYIR